MKHPNEESTHDMVEEGILDENGEVVGWTGSAFYIWFGRIDESHLKPFFIRNYSRDAIILEDEYQEVLKLPI
jgi:hypothetical protein